MRLLNTAVALLVALVLGGTATAAPIFNYTTLIPPPTPSSVSGLSGGNSITIMGMSDFTNTKDAGFPGGTNIALFTLGVTAPVGSPVQTITATTILFTLKLTDVLSNQTGTINFSALLQGSIGNNNSSLTLTNITPVSPIIQNLDGFKYTLSYTAPSLNPTGPTNFNVNIQAVAIIPEPATLAICGIFGLAGLVTARRKLKKSVEPTVAA